MLRKKVEGRQTKKRERGREKEHLKICLGQREIKLGDDEVLVERNLCDIVSFQFFLI